MQRSPPLKRNWCNASLIERAACIKGKKERWNLYYNKRISQVFLFCGKEFCYGKTWVFFFLFLFSMKNEFFKSKKN
jgi:hypothetical protein